ncbi:MAG: DUF3795 domain-containing protein [Patescibacteria group bacterium]
MGCCGYRCESCPAFRATKDGDEAALERCGAAWETLFGRRAEPGKLKCDGCYHVSGRKADPDCPVRPCCREKGYITCAECPSYPCNLLEPRFVLRAEIEARLGHALDEETYRVYVRPLENRARLDGIRKRFGAQAGQAAGGEDPET